MIKNPISYPGNKNKLASQIISFFPKDATTIVEPFCGSAAVSVNTNYERLVLNDNNPFIVDVLKYQHENSFEAIVLDTERIIHEYGLTYSRIMPKGTYREIHHEGLSRYNKAGFEKLKSDFNLDRDVRKLFVLLIYGFNHYLRFNSAGQFNVPVGKVDFSASIFRELKVFEEKFNKVDPVFLNTDYLDEKLYSFSGAIYYFDPPYLITNAPYNQNWNIQDERCLLALLDALNERDLRFALSNVISSNGKTNELLKSWANKYSVHYLNRQYRNSNYQKKNIADSVEVLVTNY